MRGAKSSIVKEVDLNNNFNTDQIKVNIDEYSI
jgi:hypothetical protein